MDFCCCSTFLVVLSRRARLDYPVCHFWKLIPQYVRSRCILLLTDNPGPIGLKSSGTSAKEGQISGPKANSLGPRGWYKFHWDMYQGSRSNICATLMLSPLLQLGKQKLSNMLKYATVIFPNHSMRPWAFIYSPEKEMTIIIKSHVTNYPVKNSLVNLTFI